MFVCVHVDRFSSFDLNMSACRIWSRGQNGLRRRRKTLAVGANKDWEAKRLVNLGSKLFYDLF